MPEELIKYGSASAQVLLVVVVVTLWKKLETLSEKYFALLERYHSLVLLLNNTMGDLKEALEHEE